MCIRIQQIDAHDLNDRVHIFSLEASGKITGTPGYLLQNCLQIALSRRSIQEIGVTSRPDFTL